ncbi:fasciclin domain-containing protein [Paradesertivirga mongoliensis]|uniref:Fasciclin domain-containing protein n=1 Tax=Paradesertivirga mongoliensis TaxID=2100740 RepID=A0ABW4ZKP0_9SPHI|nr:fasciclin domain-containing protein [Pedobacter mongoliensis]
MNLLKQKILLLLMCTAVMSSCEKKWDDHTAVTEPNFSSQLLDRINSNPDLSKFAEYLVQTNYDDTLGTGKAYTVWAPTNAALQALDPEVINTQAKLELFVANHISNLSFLTASAKNGMVRVKTLNKKSVSFTPTTVDGSVMTSKDLYLGNGVLHIISTAITPKPSAWQLVMSTNSLQKQELETITFTRYDPARAEVTGIDPLTGKPILKPGTGFYTQNRFLQRQFSDRPSAAESALRQSDISHEDSTFTYILLTDAAFTAEKAKLRKYFETSNADTTDSLTGFNVIKDLAFKGFLDKDNFPASVLSVGDSVRFHLDKNAVVETHQVSNGVVYVMSSINYDLGSGTYDKYTKIKPIIIEGESINNTVNTADQNLSMVKATNGTFEKRSRRNPDGSFYTFLYRVGHAQNINFSRYRPNEVHKVKYKVYWRVPKDFNIVPAAKASPLVAGSTIVFSQMRFAIGNPLVETPGFPYVMHGVLPVLDPATNAHQIDPISGKYLYKTDYDEKYLGEFTASRYYSRSIDPFQDELKRTLAIYQVGAASTTAPLNDMYLDYIKLVPVP